MQYQCLSRLSSHTILILILVWGATLRKIVLAIPIVLCFTWIILRVSAPPVGICAVNGRILKDAELIETALRYDDDVDLRGASSVSDYFALYPECCSVRRKNNLSFADRIFGEKEGVYPGAYFVTVVVQRKTTRRQRFVTAEFSLDACGRILESFFMDRRSLETE